MKPMRSRTTGRRTRYFSSGLFLIISVLVLRPYAARAAGAEPIAREDEISLGLSAAIGRALKNNIMMKLARERIEEIKGLRIESRSELLPQVSLTAAQGRVFWDNPAAQGLPEFGILGPFNAFDARIQIVQRAFDLSALSGFKAAETGLRISRLEEKFARQQVILSTVFAYMNVLNSEEKLRAVDEDIHLAQQLVTMAEHQLSAGVVTELDVIRAKTRLAQQRARRQDVLQALHLAYFQLMRVTALPLAANVRLSDSMAFFNEPALPVAKAIDTAFDTRIEMSLAAEKIRYQEDKLSQAKDERLPVFSVYGNYGSAGETPSKSSHEVGQIGVKLTMPAFEGGRIAGRVGQQNSRKRAEELRRDDLQVQVEEDVRLALQTLETGTDRVQAAQEAFDLAKREVELAQNQYHAGMENNIAVIEAQAVLARAHEGYIAAVTQYHLARVNYFSALGETEAFHLNPLRNPGEKNGD